MKRYWTYAIILLIIPLLTSLLNSAFQMMIVRIAVSMKCMASEAIYRKALRLTSTAKGSTSTGQLVNIMSTDTNALLMFTMWSPSCSWCPSWWARQSPLRRRWSSA